MSISVQTAKNGLEVPLVDGVRLHSMYYPDKEGRQLADNFFNTLQQPAATLVVFGLGFLYHISPLVNRYNKIYVIEPNAELIKIVQNTPALQADIPSVEIVNNPDELVLSEFDLFVYPPVARLYPEISNNLRSLIKSPADATSVPKHLKILLDYPIYGGSISVAGYVHEALDAMGHTVLPVKNEIVNEFFQKILHHPQISSGNKMTSQLTELLAEYYWAEVQTQRPDICFFNAQSPSTLDVLARIKALGIPTVFGFVEDYSRFPYWQTIAPAVDYFCTIQKGNFHEQLMQILANPVYLPMAAQPSVHRVTSLSAEEQVYYGSDVSFMGAGYPNRHSLFGQLTDYQLKIWGTDWENNSRLAPYVMNNAARVSIDETVKIYNAAKININLHSSMQAAYIENGGDFVNPRTFEILACGGFQLVDKRQLLPELLTDGEDLVCFDTLDDLKEKIDYYLANPQERQAIAAQGAKTVSTYHSYEHRLSYLLHLLVNQQTSKPVNKQENEFFQQYPPATHSLSKYIEIINAAENPLDDAQTILLILNEFASM